MHPNGGGLPPGNSTQATGNGQALTQSTPPQSTPDTHTPHDGRVTDPPHPVAQHRAARVCERAFTKGPRPRPRNVCRYTATAPVHTAGRSRRCAARWIRSKHAILKRMANIPNGNGRQRDVLPDDLFFVLVQPKTSWRRPLTSQYSRQRLGIKIQSCPILR